MKNLSKEAKIVRHSNAVAAGSTAITPSAGIDMQGFDACTFIAALGTITSTAVTSIEVHQSDDDGDTDAYSAIEGTNVTIADDDDNQLFYVDVVRPLKRYLKLIVNRGTANAVLDAIIAILYNASQQPTTQPTGVTGELHISAPEGSA